MSNQEHDDEPRSVHDVNGMTLSGTLLSRLSPDRNSTYDTRKIKMEHDTIVPVSTLAASKRAQAFTIRNIIASDIAISNEPAQRVPSLPYYDDSNEVNMEDEEDRKCRSRNLFSREQLTRLREVFQKTQYPGIQERLTLANDLRMTHKSVKQWFQNARSKMKKRGTDHVTGFYANKMAAKKGASPESVFTYDRMKINADNERGRKNSTTNCQIAVDTELITVKNSDKSENTLATSPLGSETTRNILGGCRSPSPIFSDDMDSSLECAKTSHNGKSSPPEHTSFQQMQLVSLPADHPFCNLGNPDYVWPDLSQTHAEACSLDHENSEKCEGKTHDDLLANYLMECGAMTSRHTQSPASSDDEPRSPVKKTPSNQKERRTTKRKVMENPSSGSCIGNSSEQGDYPLDLSIKRNRCKSPVKSLCPVIPRPHYHMVHPLAVVHPYCTFQFCPPGYMPLMINDCIENKTKQ